jgi:demethylmenaquinone methyltransferase/2-methoxy-6-polyprenyl-1,4-benzoquinol methylase
MAVEMPGRSGAAEKDADAAAEHAAGGSVLPAPERKHEYVRTMFDAIAPRYDLLNCVLSGPLHHGWRRAAADQARLSPGGVALDVCTGTGDLALELARRVGPSGAVIGADFSLGMLRLGSVKAEKRPEARNTVKMALADTQALPFPANSFDAVTVGFGIRNVADIRRGITEMARVTRPGGRVVILEFNQPTNRAFAALFRWYSFHLMPFLGGLISGRRSAYEYLPTSVAAFYSRAELADMMQAAGLSDVTITDQTFGTVAIHAGTKTNPASVRPPTAQEQARHI